jgi:hypothetical protein
MMRRLVVKGWASIDSVKKLTRLEVVEYNELLDALEEAADDDRRDAEEASKLKR